MSKITTAYDALKARVVALLPTHLALTNPYAPEQNTEMALKIGYGIRVAAGENSKRNLSCVLSVNRGMEIVLTRKYYGSELNRDAKEAAEKALLEDQFLLIKDVEKDPTLALSGTLCKFEYVGDTGIEFVFNEDKPFLMIVSSFNMEYFENLN